MNINKLMKQAQEMQKQVKSMQADMAQKEFEGKAGGGLVSIIMSGSGEMKKVNLDPSLVNKEDKEMLEDLIVAAHNDAKSKADQESNNNMSGMFGNMGMPPGFNL